jgi:hypothetical protein
MRGLAQPLRRQKIQIWIFWQIKQAGQENAFDVVGRFGY